MERVMTSKRILVVDPDPSTALALRGAGGFLADVESCADFLPARGSLMRDPPDFLITNLRLGAYNGLHLMYLARTNRHNLRSICYSALIDLPLIREAQSIGAFYEIPPRIPYAIGSYIRASLPERDRRQPRASDRRREFRGGRRSVDVAILARR
jgi:DNA-binding NtrC family response regulator